MCFKKEKKEKKVAVLEMPTFQHESCASGAVQFEEERMRY